MKIDALTPEEIDRLSGKLRAAGLRSTRPRLALAHLLFGSGNRHVTAETLHEEARNAGLSVSQATIYNTLNQFLSAGLLSEVIVDHARSYFDTNVAEHHHFFIEDEARLIDIPLDEVVLSTLPDAPSGYYPTGVDVVIRLDRR
ncbi:MAG: Fur family transcriptional regulator [Pseudomonadota bacterium]|nr:Fur family transcriptional regulator [Pseudomonadota bacterium]